MALIKCDECGRMISDKSVSCPGCGYPTHLNKSFKPAAEKAETETVQEAEPQQSEAPKATMPAVEEKIETPTQQPEAVAVKGGVEAAEEKNQAVTTEIADAADEPIEEEAPAEEEYIETEPELDENELAERRLRNHRHKTWLYLGSFAVVLVVVAVCYFIGKNTQGQTLEDANVAFEVTTEGQSDDVPTDTLGVEEPEDVVEVPAQAVAVKKAPVEKPVESNNTVPTGNDSPSSGVNDNSASQAAPAEPAAPQTPEPAATSPDVE